MSEAKTEARTFKVGDEVRTRSGRKARIICDDAGGEQPLVGPVL